MSSNTLRYMLQYEASRSAVAASFDTRVLIQDSLTSLKGILERRNLA